MSRALALVDRVRRLPPASRRELYARLVELGPDALATRTHDWAGFWSRPEQRVTREDLTAKLIVFTGERGEGKTRAAVEFFLAEILAGRAKRPRIIAAKAADCWGVVVHGESGIASCLPFGATLECVPTSDEAPAGVLRINGVKVSCFGAHDVEATTAYACDLDLYDDTAKWGSGGAREYQTARVSCRSGRGIGIVATTRKGLRYLHRVMRSEHIEERITVKHLARGSNAGNLTAGHATRMADEFGADALDDEDPSESSPFAGLAFDATPIRVHELGELVEIVVAIDPADGKGPSHDDWGEIVSGRRRDGHVVHLEDVSGGFDDLEAGEAALSAAERWSAVCPSARVVLASSRTAGHVVVLSRREVRHVLMLWSGSPHALQHGTTWRGQAC